MRSLLCCVAGPLLNLVQYDKAEHNMSPLLENAVLVCIVIVILFFGYHIAMYLIQRQAEQAVAKLQQSQPMRTVEYVPEVRQPTTMPLTVAGVTEVAPAVTVPVVPQSDVPTVGPPQPSDPNSKPEGSSTFTTNMRHPENLYNKHELLETSGESLSAQNEGGLGDVAAWDGDGVQPFSSL